MSRLVIDHRLCVRSGQCAYMQPKLFAMNADGAPVVLERSIASETHTADALDAIEMCPAQAISLVPE